jgi:23S rRNA (adenine2030-N6)-methyltransferase
MSVELLIQRPSDPGRLNGCGLAVVNPPYTLEGALTAILPELSRRLAVASTGAGYRLSWIGDAPPNAAKSPSRKR